MSAGALALLSACDAFDYHPYDTNIHGRTNINEDGMHSIEALNLQPPFKFAFLTDTQGTLDETLQAIDIIRSRGDIDFMIHGGDQTDFGLPEEYMWCRDAMDGAGIPWVAVLGNHDCLGNGKDTFRYIYGPHNFSFNAGGVHFVILTTVALEYDYAQPVPDFNFLEKDALAVARLNERTPGAVTHTVITMHSRPFDEQFNNNVAKPFMHYLLNYPGLGENDPVAPEGWKGVAPGSRALAFCINGHNHGRESIDLFSNGVIFHQAANIEKRNFLIFIINPEGYECESVDF